jgi:hypothetical protein
MQLTFHRFQIEAMPLVQLAGLVDSTSLLSPECAVIAARELEKRRELNAPAERRRAALALADRCQPWGTENESW